MYDLQSVYPLFHTLLKASITSSVLVGIILLARAFFRKSIGAHWQYLLWIILVLRLIFPYFPQSNLSIFNLFVSPVENVVLDSNFEGFESSIEQVPESDRAIAKMYAAMTNVSAVVTSPGEYLSLMSHRYNGVSIETLCNVWGLGVIAFLSLTLISSMRFWRKIRKVEATSDKKINELIRVCSDRMNIRRHIPVIITSRVSSPAIYGLFRPKLLLPENIISVVGESKIKYIVLHELAHYKRKDIAINVLISVLQALHWFNPIIWYSFYIMKQDRELACDALALEYLEPNENKQYGETIIDLLKSSVTPLRYSGVIGILSSKSQMKRRINMISLFKGKSRKWTTIAIVLVVLLSSVVLTSAVGVRKVDNIDYPFADDQQVIGKWQSVDFVKSISEFEPGSKKWDGELFLNEMVFVKDGQMFSSIGGGQLSPGPWEWTKGIITHDGDKTASKYEIKDIDGAKYMFFEWKSGDYTLRGMEPYYYVLKKMDGSDYSTYTPERKTDNTEYTFETDPQMIGEWKSVDFVKNINDFVPNVMAWQGGLYLTGLNFQEDGKVMTASENGSGQFKWTKGLFINKADQTASKCIVKEIEGSTYMFFEWKSGDYVFRGMDPYYYVLKKVQ